MSVTADARRLGLTAAEISHWQEHGHVAVPDFFTPDETALLQEEVRVLQRAGRLRNVATSGDGRTASTTAANFQVCPVGPHSRPIRALAHARTVTAAITSLIGPTAVLHLDQIFLKPARQGVGTGWHTDNAYFRSRLVEAGTGLWIAVHAAHRENGTMRLIPGSHRAQWAHRRDPGSDHHVTCVDAVDPDQAMDIELPAGGALFFNYGVVHSTGGNQTDADRAALALHFVREEEVPADDRFVLSPEDMSSRRLFGGDGGWAVHGEDLRGVWESLTETAR
jgi:ectoine hydroxylase-related dioxygenase (phytanoyl-CoA dioxygenase family)